MNMVPASSSPGLKLFFLLATVLVGSSCKPPDDQVGADAPPTDNTGDTVTDTYEGPRCHSGTFECADGAEVTPCGTWYFDVNESGGVTGGGEIDIPLSGLIAITLSGIIDEGVEAHEIILSSASGGRGEITLSYPGPTEELAGAWSFTDAPEPEGIELGGGAAGTSCTQLP